MTKHTPTVPDPAEAERAAAYVVAGWLLECGFRIGITGIGWNEPSDASTRRAIEPDWPHRPITTLYDFQERFSQNPRARGVMIVHGRFDLPGIDTWAIDADGLPGLESIRYLMDLGIVSTDDCMVSTPNGRHVIFEWDHGRGFKNWTANNETWSFDPTVIPGPDGDGRLPGIDIRVQGGNTQAYAMRDDGEYRFHQERPRPLIADEGLYGVTTTVVREPLPQPPQTPLKAAERRVYATTALANEYDELVRQSRGDRNSRLNNVAYSFGRRFVSDGSLQRFEVEHYLEQAATLNRLVAEDGIRSVRATIRSGLDAGTRSAGIERGAA